MGDAPRIRQVGPQRRLRISDDRAADREGLLLRVTDVRRTTRPVVGLMFLRCEVEISSVHFDLTRSKPSSKIIELHVRMLGEERHRH